MIRGNDPILLTPGPLTTSLRTKQAMLNDWGSWDAAFNSITASIRRDVVEIINGGDDYTCVPLQGSGTFSVEAAIGTLVPRDGKVLVPNNGAYCARIVRICKYLNRAVVDLAVPEDQPTTGAIVEAALAADPSITHVAQVHCETGAGMLNDSDRRRASLPQTRQGLDRRRDELVCRTADRRAHDSIRCAGRRQRQMPGRRAGHGLRDRQEEHCSRAARATRTRWRWICTISTSTWRRRRSGATRRRRMSSRHCALRSISSRKRAVSLRASLGTRQTAQH